MSASGAGPEMSRHGGWDGSRRAQECRKLDSLDVRRELAAAIAAYVVAAVDGVLDEATEIVIRDHAEEIASLTATLYTYPIETWGDEDFGFSPLEED